MNPIHSILFLIFALAGLGHGHAGERKAVDVASLRPRDLIEFDSLPKAIRGILEYGLSLTGKKLGYRYGSCDPANGGMDCSGTVYHILRRQGLNPPRSSHTFYLWVREHGNLHEVKGAASLSDKQFAALQPGDLLFWEGTYNVGERFPPISHVMIFAGHQKSDGRPVAIGASSGRYYAGRARHGVSVFDLQLPREGSQSKFVGYGPIPGIRNLGIKLPPVVRPASFGQ